MKSKKNSNNQWILTFLMCVVVSCTAVLINNHFAFKHEQKFVYLNMQELSMSAMQQIEIENENMEDDRKYVLVQIAARNFTNKVMEAVTAYEDQGYVVVLRKSIIGGPTDLDITNAVAEYVGVKIDYTPKTAIEALKAEFSKKNLR